MMKLKLSPDILDMVKIFYAVNKATEMLECLIEFGQMSNESKLEFSAAASEDESSSLHYKKCLAVSLLPQEDVKSLKDLILEGNEDNNHMVS